MMDDDYKSSDYFAHRHYDEVVAHIITNSCDNLVGLNAGPVPTSHIEIPNVGNQPSSPVGKPSRSDPDPVDATAAVPPPKHIEVDVSASSNVASEYYDELRRRSLEGRAPMRMTSSGAHPLEENVASEEFDVALY